MVVVLGRHRGPGRVVGRRRAPSVDREGVGGHRRRHQCTCFSAAHRHPVASPSPVLAVPLPWGPSEIQPGFISRSSTNYIYKDTTSE